MSFRQDITYRIVRSFDDAAIAPSIWNELLAQGSSDVFFMTWEWQKAWWEVLGRGELLIVLAEKNAKPFAIAPLFTEYGMLYLVGSGGSDYLDFIGNIDRAEILEAMLQTAVGNISDFQGFQFYHIPEASKSTELIAAVATKKGWKIYEEGQCVCPELELEKHPEEAIAATRKKSLLRHEAYFRKNGLLEVEHHKTAETIEPFLEEFFNQHISRWETTRFPSLFHEEKQRRLYTKITALASNTGCLRFTRIIWNGKNIAFHFGFNYKGSFFWLKPTFDISLAKHSPGEVLLRQLLLRAIEEAAHTFDFGLGDEAFKSRFATGVKRLKNWGLYKSVSKNVLVISPHPDDESIGCGGTIRKHIIEGDKVEVIFLTSGEHGGVGKTMAEETIRLREEEARQAAMILQINAIDFWREPDGAFEVNEKTIRKLSEKIVDFGPSLIYVPHEMEDHRDHKAAARLVRETLQQLPESVTSRPTVFMYEVWTPIQEFKHIVDITPYVDVKRNAIKKYESQCSLVKFDEAILSLNRYRGEMHSWPGGDYAEIFTTWES